MATREAELGLRKTGDPRDAAYADVIAGILRARGKDISPPKTLISKEGLTDSDLFNLMLIEYKQNPHNPETVTQTFQAIWRVRQGMLRAERVDLEFSVPECPYTEEQLKHLERLGRRVGYLPEELATQASRHLMAKIWPQMGSRSVQEGNTVTNGVNRSGWFDYEAQVGAPHLDTTEDSLRKAVKKEERLGMNLNEYIIASQDSKLLTGKYLDEALTWIRLLGSRDKGDVVRVGFDADGYLAVGWNLHPQDRNSDLGGRSVGVPKTA